MVCERMVGMTLRAHGSGPQPSDVGGLGGRRGEELCCPARGCGKEEHPGRGVASVGQAKK